MGLFRLFLCASISGILFISKGTPHCLLLLDIMFLFLIQSNCGHYHLYCIVITQNAYIYINTIICRPILLSADPKNNLSWCSAINSQNIQILKIFFITGCVVPERLQLTKHVYKTSSEQSPYISQCKPTIVPCVSLRASKIMNDSSGHQL